MKKAREGYYITEDGARHVINKRVSIIIDSNQKDDDYSDVAAEVIVDSNIVEMQLPNSIRKLWVFNTDIEFLEIPSSISCIHIEGNNSLKTLDMSMNKHAFFTKILDNKNLEEILGLNGYIIDVVGNKIEELDIPKEREEWAKSYGKGQRQITVDNGIELKGNYLSREITTLYK